MIGNDLVDLRYAKIRNNWRRPGFLKKVCTEREQRYIGSSANPDAMIWRLWTMKESAYKVYLRESAARFFNPKRLECQIINERAGLVSVGSSNYKTITTANSKYIHSIAYLAGGGTFESSCFSFNDSSYSNQHREAHKKVRAKMAELLGVPAASIDIRKNVQGIPAIYAKDQLLSSYLTITHHGTYGAFAFTKPSL